MSDGSGFKVGDTVRMKSGGPLMTVSNINDGAVYCEWFGADGKVARDSFRPEQLKPSDNGLRIK